MTNVSFTLRAEITNAHFNQTELILRQFMIQNYTFLEVIFYFYNIVEVTVATLNKIQTRK